MMQVWVTLVWVGMLFHKYYVGLVQLDVHPVKQRIEGSFRWFEDDVDKAVFQAYHEHLDINAGGYTDSSQRLLAQYWKTHVLLKCNQLTATPTIKHIEREQQVVVFYVTWPLPRKLQSIHIYIDALMEAFPQQEHLVRCQAFGSTQSETFSLHKTQHTFSP